MTPDDLNRLDALLREATPGQWPRCYCSRKCRNKANREGDSGE